MFFLPPLHTNCPTSFTMKEKLLYHERCSEEIAEHILLDYAVSSPIPMFQWRSPVLEGAAAFLLCIPSENQSSHIQATDQKKTVGCDLSFPVHDSDVLLLICLLYIFQGSLHRPSIGLKEKQQPFLNLCRHISFCLHFAFRVMPSPCIHLQIQRSWLSAMRQPFSRSKAYCRRRYHFSHLVRKEYHAKSCIRLGRYPSQSMYTVMHSLFIG